VPDPHPEPRPPDPAGDELRAALARARRGDRAALPVLRDVLARPEFWQTHGDLALHAERAWIDLICGPDLVLAEALGRKTGAMKDELAGPAPTPLERLLVGRIVATWLQVSYESASQAQARDVSLKQAELTSRRLARAHKGLLMAVGTLATVRRLLPSAPVPASAGAIPRRTDGESPGLGPREPGVAGPEAMVPLAEDDDRVQDPAGPGPLALFDRPGTVPGRGDGPGGRRGGRGRSAS
jgi:hypothetical protein